MQLNPEIEAGVYYLSTQEGGRKTPVFNGYRGQKLGGNRNKTVSKK